MLTILQGDASEQLRTLPDESMQCCVTSPPYWGLRDYGQNGQLGLEKTPDEYVAKMVEVFREVRRVLRKDGTLWLNLGDSYARAGGWSDNSGLDGLARGESGRAKSNIGNGTSQQLAAGLKEKDLCGIPWRVAFALQADGWWLRSDIIWAKPNPMPESVKDRPTKSHEYLFLLTKASSYFYDAEAIKEPLSQVTLDECEYAYNGTTNGDWKSANAQDCSGTKKRIREAVASGRLTGRNKRSVWTVPTQSYPEAHFATYPPDLIKPCIMAGTSAKGCCALCGAPWARVVEVERSPRGDTFGNRDGAFDRGQAGSAYQQVTSSKTLGWQPTCECFGKIIEEKIEVPAAKSPESWNGSAFDDGKNIKVHPNTGTKRNEPRFKIIHRYEPSIPLDEHPVEACVCLDPLAGSGTTGAVALELGRKAVLIELNPNYCELIRQRCDVTPGLQLA